MQMASRELIKHMLFRWDHTPDVIIVNIHLSISDRFRVDKNYSNTTYNTTYSDVRFVRLTNACSLTNVIELFSIRLKYSFILESSNIE